MGEGKRVVAVVSGVDGVPRERRQLARRLRRGCEARSHATHRRATLRLGAEKRHVRAGGDEWRVGRVQVDHAEGEEEDVIGCAAAAQSEATPRARPDASAEGARAPRGRSPSRRYGCSCAKPLELGDTVDAAAESAESPASCGRVSPSASIQPREPSA